MNCLLILKLQIKNKLLFVAPILGLTLFQKCPKSLLPKFNEEMMLK